MKYSVQFETFELIIKCKILSFEINIFNILYCYLSLLLFNLILFKKNLLKN